MRRIGLTAIGLLALTPAAANAEYGTVARGWPVVAPDGVLVAGPWGGPVLFHDWSDGADPESIVARNLDGTIRWKDGHVFEGGISTPGPGPAVGFAVQANGMFGPTREPTGDGNQYYDAAGATHTFNGRVMLESDLFATAISGDGGFDVSITRADNTPVWHHHEAGVFEWSHLQMRVIDGGVRLIFVGDGAGGVVAFDRATGVVRWRLPHASPRYRIGTDGLVIETWRNGWTLVALDATGAEVVPQRPQDYGKAFTKSGLRLEPTTVNKRHSLRAIRPNGSVAWQYSTTSPVGHAVELPDGTIAFTLAAAGPGQLLTRINPHNVRRRATTTTISLSRTRWLSDACVPGPFGVDPTCNQDPRQGAVLRIASPYGTTMSLRFKEPGSTWTSFPVPAGVSFTYVNWRPGTYTLQVRRGTTGPIIRSIPVTITK